MVERDHKDLTIAGQCKLLIIHRSGFYYMPRKESALNLVLMREIDEHFLRYPFIGSRRMAQWLKHKGFKVNRKRIQRLYRLIVFQNHFDVSRLTSFGVNIHQAKFSSIFKVFFYIKFIDFKSTFE